MTRIAIKFGVFVLVCLSLTIALAFTIGNINVRDPLGRNYYNVAATFDDVTGLLPDDNVKIAGVVVGKISGIEAKSGRARVTFLVKDSVRIPADSAASIRWRNLIGQRYLYLQPGTAPTMLPDDGKATIEQTTSVVDIGELFNRLGPIISSIDEKQVNQFLETISQALQGNTDKVGQAIDDLAVLARTLSSRDATIGRLLTNLNTLAGTITNRDQQIRVMLDNLVLISKTFSDNSKIVDTALSEFGRFSTSLRSVLGTNNSELDRIISNLELLTTDVVRPRISSLQSTLAALDTASAKIFAAGDLGEWLNQSILCASTAPPTGGAPDNCAGASSVATTGSASAAHAQGAAITVTAVGSQAPSMEAGVRSLVQIITAGRR